jgi:hypothetical protein
MLNTQLPQPNQQHKTKQFGLSGIIIGKKTTPPPHNNVVNIFLPNKKKYGRGSEYFF